MSSNPVKHTPIQSAEIMSLLIETKLGIVVKPKKLKRFIEKNWHPLHAHAHNIFDNSKLGKRLERRRKETEVSYYFADTD